MTTKTDPWRALEYARVDWYPVENRVLAQCKVPVEGRRCNAKFNGADAVRKLAAHQQKIHERRFSFARRFGTLNKKG